MLSSKKEFLKRKKNCGGWGQRFSSILPFRSGVWADGNLSKTFSSFQEIYGPVEVGRQEGRKVVCALKISMES